MKRQELTFIENEGTVFERAMKAMGTIIPLEYRAKGGCGGFDHLVRGKMLGHPFVWCVEEKKRLTKADEPRTLLIKDKAPHPFLLATEYVPQEAAERLREAGIQFIDTVGNAFINHPPVLIYVKGNKPYKPEPKPQVGRLFKGVGLKVIYALLCRPELIEKPYRDLAEITGVALGTIKNTMADLTEKGFILDRGKQGKRLLNRKVLFERWAEAYPDALKPKLFLGRFHGDRYWWKDLQLDATVAQWGGEVAAAKLTGYLKPGTVTLYADRKKLAELVINNRLKKDPEGDVEILNRFWQADQDFDEGDTVHPFLIYADLVALGDPRTMETAKILYEQHLERYFRQD